MNMFFVHAYCQDSFPHEIAGLKYRTPKKNRRPLASAMSRRAELAAAGGFFLFPAGAGYISALSLQTRDSDEPDDYYSHDPKIDALPSDAT